MFTHSITLTNTCWRYARISPVFGLTKYNRVSPGIVQGSEHSVVGTEQNSCYVVLPVLRQVGQDPHYGLVRESLALGARF